MSFLECYQKGDHLEKHLAISSELRTATILMLTFVKVEQTALHRRQCLRKLYDMVRSLDDSIPQNKRKD